MSSGKNFLDAMVNGVTINGGGFCQAAVGDTRLGAVIPMSQHNLAVGAVCATLQNVTHTAATS